MKFRKRPVVIEAAPIWLLIDYARNNWQGLPEWVQNGYDDGKILFKQDGISIQTLEGTMFGPSGHMLIQGVEGELYACEPGIFVKTYEPVDE